MPITSSNEFVALVEQLHQSPNNSALKAAVLQQLPTMLAIAAKDNNPMILYHLAHVYPPNSSQYKQTMRQSANLGCTNAMLIMCQILAKAGSASEWKKAVHYLKMIQKSSDSYIKEQAQKLTEEFPQLKSMIGEHDQPHLFSRSMHQFFAHKQTTVVENTPICTDAYRGLKR